MVDLNQRFAMFSDTLHFVLFYQRRIYVDFYVKLCFHVNQGKVTDFHKLKITQRSVAN